MRDESQQPMQEPPLNRKTYEFPEPDDFDAFKAEAEAPGCGSDGPRLVEVDSGSDKVVTYDFRLDAVETPVQAISVNRKAAPRVTQLHVTCTIRRLFCV